MRLSMHPFQAMGCPCELRFYAQTDDMADKVVTACIKEVRRFEAKYSRYQPDSLISAINRSAGFTRLAIDQETYALLNYSGVCYDLSEGLFDITSGVLRRLWHKDMTELPNEADLTKSLELVGWHKIELNEDSICLPLPGMELDFGGVVKEYVADALAELSREMGIEHGLINLGGDIRIIGPQENGAPWQIGIVHPTLKNTAIAVIELHDGGLTTSGGYERYFEIDGKRYSHLIDPTTGWPVESLYCASVAAPQAIVAGSLTSIALLKSTVTSIEFLESCKFPFFAVDNNLRCYGHLTNPEMLNA